MPHHRPSSAGDSYDVALIGSGMASTFVAMGLVERLIEREPPTATRMAIFEKSSDFFAGTAYDRRSGDDSLVLTPLKEFLPPPELEAFSVWMAGRHDWLLEQAEHTGRVRSVAWLQREAEAMLTGRCDELHIPRFLWGLYIGRGVRRLVQKATARGVLELSLIRAEVTAVRASPSGYEILSRAGTSESRTAVLALGIPPTRKLFGGDGTGCLLVEDPYAPDLESTLQRIARRVAAAGEPAEILLIGANASALEMIHEFACVPAIRDSAARILVLSPQGRLPERYEDKSLPRFVPTHLADLAALPDIAAAEILEAVKLDLEDARAEQLGISDSLPPITAGVGKLVPLLCREEKEAFANGPGAEIGRLQRRAGNEVCDVAEELAAAGRLRVVAGRYVGLDALADDAATVHYRDTDGRVRDLERPFTVLVNCSGSAGVERPNQSPLIESLLAEGTCEATPCGHGFKVNDRFEAQPGLFVNGPLLAGNVVGDTAIWHVEHCGRIIAFSDQLAGHLAAALELDGDPVERPGELSPRPARPVVTRTPFWKRAFDVVGAAAGLLALSPIFAIVAALVRCKLGSPVIYSQRRPGLGGTPFRMWKFRSMLDVADAAGRPLPDEERLTPFGSWLRRTSLDELPGLINVLRGDMSLVGPRPLLMKYLPLYSQAQMRRHAVRPGLTGLAQVNGRNAISWDEKFGFDLEYVDNLSPWLDLGVILRTLGAVIRGTGVSAEEMSAGMRTFTGND